MQPREGPHVRRRRLPWPPLTDPRPPTPSEAQTEPAVRHRPCARRSEARSLPTSPGRTSAAARGGTGGGSSLGNRLRLGVPSDRRKRLHAGGINPQSQAWPENQLLPPASRPALAVGI